MPLMVSDHEKDGDLSNGKLVLDVKPDMKDYVDVTVGIDRNFSVMQHVFVFQLADYYFHIRQKSIIAG